MPLDYIVSKSDVRKRTAGVELHSQKMIDFLKTEIRTKHLKTGSRLPIP